MNLLKPYWQKSFSFNKKLGIALLFICGIPRFILVLEANQTGNYNKIPIIFILMIILPFTLLTKNGRKQTGIKKPDSIKWLFFSFTLGIIFCTIFFILAKLFFGDGISNAFEYISNSYAVAKNGMQPSDKLIYFIIYAIIGMTFSPLGEELFYRGLVHDSLVTSYGDNKASNIDSLAFSITHLAHFGIVFSAGSWEFLLIPALFWLAGIFLAGRLFFYCRKKTGSILGAILAHAGFNLAMMYLIFYYIF